LDTRETPDWKVVPRFEFGATLPRCLCGKNILASGRALEQHAGPVFGGISLLK
jgi:hypothetical protein